MRILGNRVLVSKLEEEKKEGFQTVDVQDSFVYKGKVEALGADVEINARPICNIGDTILFAKYSPDTHDVEIEGKKLKAVAVADIIAIL